MLDPAEFNAFLLYRIFWKYMKKFKEALWTSETRSLKSVLHSKFKILKSVPPLPLFPRLGGIRRSSLSGLAS